MERFIKDRSIKKSGGNPKKGPECERCGRPVKIDSDDYEREEILCATCALESKTPETEESEPVWSE